METRRRLVSILMVLLAAILACNVPTSSVAPTKTGAGVSIVDSPPAPALLKPAEFAAQGGNLAQIVADLNLVQMAFISDAKSSAPVFSQLDGELVHVAVVAMQLGQTAGRLGQAAIAQNAGRSAIDSRPASVALKKSAQKAGPDETADKLAGQYFGLARVGYSLVINTQNTRAALAKGALTPSQAAEAVAQGGARLWNPAAGDPDQAANPFAPFLSNPASAPVPFLITGNNLTQIKKQIGGEPLFWLASSAGSDKIPLSIPAPNPASASTDLQAYLASAASPLGQADGNQAQQAAFNQLASLGAQISPPALDGTRKLTVPLPQAAVVTGGKSADTDNLPALKGGQAGAVTLVNTGSDPTDTLLSFNGETPQVTGSVQIAEAKALVILNITGITLEEVNKHTKDINSTFEAKIKFSFTVEWKTTLSSPNFNISCNNAITIDVSTSSGSKRFSADGLLILYPGAETAYCYASTLSSGNQLGSASVSFLVGDSPGATQRALQVETDSVSLDLTLTADAIGTQNAETTSAAATRQVLGTQNALETEVSAQQTAEFAVTITAAARMTAQAVPPPSTETPVPTPTFTPQLLENLFIPGDVMAVSTKNSLKPNRLYRICLSGFVYVTNGVLSADQIMHVNGIKLPGSGCLTFEGSGSAANISCSSDAGVTLADDPGGYAIQVFDLGPH